MVRCWCMSCRSLILVTFLILWCGAVGALEIVVDNDTGAPGYVETGDWTLSASTGYGGGTYRYAYEVPTRVFSTATWRPDITSAGLYTVFAAYRQSNNRTTSAPLTISHAGGTSVVYLNQFGATGANQTVETRVGDFEFSAGTAGFVQMGNDGPAGAYIADAFIWRTFVDPEPSITLLTRTPTNPQPSDTVIIRATITDNAGITSAALSYTAGISGIAQIVPAYDDGAHQDGVAGDNVFAANIPPQPMGYPVKYSMAACDTVGQESTTAEFQYIVGQQAGTVYVVMSSDTSVWANTSGGDDANTHANEFDWDTFSSRTGPVSQVFNPVYRSAHVDSFGGPIKITWFMHGGGWFTLGTNSTPVSAMYHMRRNWGQRITECGDGLEYHFHHFTWSGSEWVMAPTFAQTIWDYEWAMSAMMLDERVFITAFRSGWNYMDNPYQQYLERWVPFRMEGVQSGWTPYHPSFSNWRSAGTMKGWETKHIYTNNVTQSVADQAFSSTAQGSDRVICIWSHQNEGDYAGQLASVDLKLRNASATYAVPFMYCTAKEAMQKYQLHDINTTPPLVVNSSVSGNTVDVTVWTANDIYQEQPWVAARRYTGPYVRLNTVKTAPGTWQFSYSRQEYDRVGVGVSDIYGNSALADVDDGSRRWAVQSEFAAAQPVQVDFDSSPTCVRLAKTGGQYLGPGTLTFDHSMPERSTWNSIVLSGNVPVGTNIRCRYKMAANKALLDGASWSSYMSGPAIPLPTTQQIWIRMEALLEGTALVSPELNSLEVKYDRATNAADRRLWELYD